MHASVRNNYEAFTTVFEGTVPWMYLDVKGLVTTGIGNLINSIGAAQALPWRRPDGGLASPQEIADAWTKVHNAQAYAKLGGGNTYWQTLTDLRLDQDGIVQLVNAKLDANEAIYKKRFPAWDSWPADAQLATHSMGWAMGPNFRFPRWEAAVTALVPNFAQAAEEAKMNETGNPGLVPRNVANKALFQSAADTLKNNWDITQINWAGFDALLAKGAAALVAAAKSGAALASSAQTVARAHKGISLGTAAVALGAGGALAFLAWKGVEGHK